MDGGVMPVFLENALKQAAAKKGFKGKRAARYVYGAMNNMGAMRGNRETAKGARMQAKHDKKLSVQGLLGKARGM
jgi:hypothetical protein